MSIFSTKQPQPSNTEQCCFKSICNTSCWTCLHQTCASEKEKEATLHTPAEKLGYIRRQLGLQLLRQLGNEVSALQQSSVPMPEGRAAQRQKSLQPVDGLRSLENSTQPLQPSKVVVGVSHRSSSVFKEVLLISQKQLVFKLINVYCHIST